MQFSHKIPPARRVVDPFFVVNGYRGRLWHRVGFDGQLDDNAKGAAATAVDGPEEISVPVLVGCQNFAISNYYYRLDDAIGSHAELAR